MVDAFPLNGSALVILLLCTLFAAQLSHFNYKHFFVTFVVIKVLMLFFFTLCTSFTIILCLPICIHRFKISRVVKYAAS